MALPIEVELPDGTIAEFPEGTDQSVIKRVLQQRFQQQSSGPPIVRSAPVEPLQNGMPMSQATHQRQDFPEHPAFRNQTPEQALATARSGLRNPDPNASISQDRFGNPTITMHGQQYYLNKPGVGLADILDGAGRVAEGVAEAAPYLATGVATAPMKAIPALAAQAFTGALEETADQATGAMRGEGFDWREVGKMSLLAAGGEVAGRVVSFALGPVLRRMAGGQNIRVMNEDGSLTDDAISLLNRNNVTPEQADDLVGKYLQQTNAMTPEQAERFNLFKQYGMTGTRAQVMRTADLFQEQQELAKRSNQVRGVIESQNAQVANLMDDAASRAGGTGTGVYDAISTKALKLDDEISSLYRAADEAAGGGQVVRLEGFVNELRSNAGQNQITNGLIRSLRSDLSQRGIIDDNWRVVGRVDARTAEEVRKVMNSLYNSTTDRGRQLIRQFKDSLDDDVFRAAGEDIYKQARQAKAKFEAGLRRNKLNKFDKNTRSLVRDVLENRVNADDFFDRAVLSKTWKADDLKEVKTYLTSGAKDQVTMGQDAWDSLRRETLGWIKEQAFRYGAAGENGVTYLNANSLSKALERIGRDRMNVLFSEQEHKFLYDMLKIAQARTPVPGTALGKGPSAQAVADLKEVLPQANSMPLIGGWLDRMVIARDGKIMLNPARETEAAIRRLQPNPLRDAVRATGGVSGAVYGESR